MTTEVFAYGDYTCPQDWQSFDDGGTFHKLYYVRGGHAVYHDADHEYSLQQNHLYLFPMYHKYHITHDPDHPFQVWWMHIGCLQPLTFHTVAIGMEKESLELRLIELISTAMKERPELLPLLTESLLQMLEQKLPKTMDMDPRINRVLQAIYEHDAISNEELAKISSYHPSYLIRLFKKQLGVTPQQYVIHQRMNKAKKLLSEGCSVSETAELLSFSDPNVFSRDFSKVCGCAPSQFQKDHRWRRA